MSPDRSYDRGVTGPPVRPANRQYAGVVLVGFDIGGTKALGLLIDPADGSIVDRGRESSAGEGPVLVDTLVGIVTGFEERNDTEIEAIGLGVAGAGPPVRGPALFTQPARPDRVPRSGPSSNAPSVCR